MSPRKGKAKGRPPTSYNRRVMCGYVAGPEVIKGYQALVRRMNDVRPKGEHKITVSALAGRLLEGMLPLMEKHTPEQVLKGLYGAKAKAER